MTGGFPDLWIVLLAAVILVALLVAVAVLVLRGAMKKESAPALPPIPGPGLQLARESAVATSFQSALEVLRQRVTGNSFQYRVPWILMIGPPGSGKTSILDSLSAAALQDPSVPSSKNDSWISWGFLNRGVVIDAPGSLLLGPTADVKSDERGWDQMLRRLNRHRPARPLDGIVLTFSAPELLDSTIDIAAKGALIRAKLDQLQSAVGLVLPVYVVITKCDAIRGFGSFCKEIEKSNPDWRKEIFGWSNDHTLESVFAWVWVDEALASLHRTLREHQLRIFGTPKPLDSADELFLFPPEFQLLRDPLRSLLTQLFVPVSYRDSHYFRGVYFSGLPEEPGPAATGKEVTVAGGSGRKRSPLFFLDHLFDRKIFVEKTLARPVAQRFMFRNRIVLGAQMFAAVFSLLMFIGLSVDYIRLSRARENTLLPAINTLEQSLGVASDRASIDSAYGLAETFAFMHASGFRSAFMPASWHDPIEEQVQELLEKGFRNLVLAPFKRRLEDEYRSMANAPVNELPQDHPDCATPIAGPGSVWLAPANSPQYQALRSWVARMAALEPQVQTYERLSTYGSGSVADVLELLQYFTGKKLPAARQFETNPYFTRAIQSVQWQDVDVTASRKQTASRTGSLISQFYEDWFTNSILLQRVGCLRTDLAAFERSERQTVPELRALAEKIADVDQIFSGNSIQWLEQPFTMQSDPVLNQLDNLKPVFGINFEEIKAEKEAEGQDAWQKLRADLMAQQTTSGAILERAAPTAIHLSSKLQSLGTNLEYLVGLDFMASAGTQALTAAPSSPIFWNQDLLNEALKMNESWEKYEKDVLPTIPPGLQGPVKSVAQHNLIGVMTELVTKARTPLSTNRQDDILQAELKNFNQTLEARRQIQAIGEKARPAGNPLITTLSLYSQAVRLLGAANMRLSGDSYYSYDTDYLKTWDGATPISLDLYKAESPDSLADAINTDHERLRTLVDSAGPLVQLISDQGLPVGDARQAAAWSKLGADFKLFGDKKPGNPIGTLETFLRQDIDKITPESHCQGGAADGRVSDPFISSLNSLRTDAIRACLGLVRQRYIALADNFRQHLAGKFPFSSDNASSAEADPDAVAAFFAMFDKDGATLIDSLDRLGTLDASYRTPAQQAIAFLKTVGKIRPLFATAEGSTVPVLDVTPQFRTNQGRETGGNQIIDWELRIGDQAYPFPMPAKPIRWHYADPVTLTMRYAKDSLNVPVAKGPDSNVQIGDRRITYTYKSGWGLFALLLDRAAAPTGFDNPLAPLPNTIKLTFGNAPGASAATSAKPPDTTVFVSFTLQSPAAKEGAAKAGVVVSAFPVSAPVMP